jgi:precorrin-6B C5,15-methyltransferase / cobalt-precorrin-6B C5,C15-methyltransferase
VTGYDDAVAVTVIGCDGAALSAAAQAALDRATLVIGGARHLNAVTLPHDARTITLGPLAPAVAALIDHDGPAVVLASGDPGFFGIVRTLSERGLEPPRLRVIPATSSIQAAFSRVGLAWDDALVASMHGTSGGRDLRRVANLCRAFPKVALLTGPAKGVRQEDSRQMDSRQMDSRQADSRQADSQQGDPLQLDSQEADSRQLDSRQAESWHAVSAHQSQPAETTEAPAPTGEQGAGHGVWDLAAELIRSDIARPEPARTLIVAQRLGSVDERVERLTLDQAAARSDFAEPNVVICLAESTASSSSSSPSPPRWLAGWAGPGTGPWARTESAFEHRDGQITKPEVRAQILARLAPGPGDLVWDVGAGSGSVGIECARFGAAVVAVERDAESCERISANAATHGVSFAVSVACGCAPEVLARLPLPDAVFVGGGGLDVMRAVLPFRPRTVVVALAAVERVGEVTALLEADGREVGGVLLQSSRLAALPGGVHRFAAQNPVFLVWGDVR